MPNDNAIAKDFIGTLVRSNEKSIVYESFNYSLDFQKNFYFDDKLNIETVHSIVYLKNQDKFIFSDNNEGSLKTVTNILGTNTLIQAFKDSHLEKPLQLCVGRNDELFVGDQNKIVVFDSNLTFLRIFKTNLANDYKMKVDLTDRRSLLYISDFIAGEIVVRLSNYNKIENKINILRPEYMDFDENFLYVTSYPIYQLRKQETQVSSIQKRSNCIFVLNKFNYEVVRTIKSAFWLGPQGLFIDQCSNIFTVVSQLECGYILSRNKCLCINDSQHDDSMQFVEFFEDESKDITYFINENIFIVCYGSSLDIYCLNKQGI